jgi:iron complex outermembrane recepter protein
MQFHRALLGTASALAFVAGSAAEAGQSAPGAADANSGVFGLGQIEQVRITASPYSRSVSESRINRDDIYRFNALTLDRALDLAPGVVSGQTGGSRNEKLFFIRGFDRFQSPLYVDGVRVYLPADNRLDIGFFPTGNIAQIQVQKGYVSVMSGPGSIGGAINIVTRKPVQPYEYETSAGAQFGMDGYNGHNASALVGGNDGKVYWQASGAITNLDRFSLSRDFKTTASEDGGIREQSGNRNYSMNLKLGITPKGNDEYSISYSGNWGQKSAPFSVNDTVATQRYWRWPYWDLQSLYFLSNTGIGETAYVRTKVYYNTFRNGLYSYDNANYNTQTAARAFQSNTSDQSVGASIEAGNDFGRDIVKGAFFYRRDTHREYQDIFAPVFREPWQVSEETTFSLAGENRFHVTDRVDFVLGASYDWRVLHSANEYVPPTVNNRGVVTPGSPVVFPLANGNAPNGQAALIYNYSETGHVYANVSDRARFPTLFERFSTRFNSTLSNPNLKPERAINYEIGGGENFFGNTRLDGAVFYSTFSNGLINVPILFCDTTNPATPKNCAGAGGAPGISTAVQQTQNVGDGQFYGFEFAVDSRVREDLAIGGRFTFINRHLDAQSPVNPPLPATFHMTGVPNTQFLAYATYDILPNLSVTPNIQIDSDRWSNQSSNNNVFIKTGAFFLLNIQVNWKITDRIDLLAGARNLTDSNYQLTAGFPNEGRSFFMNLRFRS